MLGVVHTWLTCFLNTGYHCDFYYYQRNAIYFSDKIPKIEENDKAVSRKMDSNLEAMFKKLGKPVIGEFNSINY